MALCPMTQCGSSCYRHECAFWDSAREQCCILSAALALAGPTPKEEKDLQDLIREKVKFPSSFC